ncbi:MAG: hypothetical protein P8M54_02485, partial [Flavobacterium sp.]|nr:hypothetical protein [Flavobacterium sp.]
MKNWIISCCLLLSVGVIAQVKTIKKLQLNIENGIAIQGYDPVAYFKQAKAIKGQKQLSVQQEGVLYYFSSETKQVVDLSPAEHTKNYFLTLAPAKYWGDVYGWKRNKENEI